MYQSEFNIITLLCIGTSQHRQYHAKEAGSDSLYCTGVFLLLLSSEDNSKPLSMSFSIFLLSLSSTFFQYCTTIPLSWQYISGNSAETNVESQQYNGLLIGMIRRNTFFSF